MSGGGRLGGWWGGRGQSGKVAEFLAFEIVFLVGCRAGLVADTNLTGNLRWHFFLAARDFIIFSGKFFRGSFSSGHFLENRFPE